MAAAKRAGIILLATLIPLVAAGAAHAAGSRGLIDFAGRNVKWGAPDYGSGAEITYAFLQRPQTFAGARNCARMLPIHSLTKRALVSRAALREIVRRAAAVWSAAAPIRFREIDDADKADIVIGAQDGTRGVAFTNVSRDDRGGPVSPLTKATICLDPSERWSAGFDGDPRTYDLPRVLVHELGHAIGLDHQGRDTGIMGYAYIEQRDIALAPTDIAALTRLYGSPAAQPNVLPATFVPRIQTMPPAPGCSPGAGGTVDCSLAAGAAAMPETARPAAMPESIAARRGY